MISLVKVGLIGITAGLASGLLHRKLCQRRAAAALRIRNDRGIVEERFEEIGGIDQWIGIRGEDRDNPVLLVIHGGPGSPCSIFTPVIRSWERHFTVVQWDQRGAGKTLGRTGRDGTGELTLDRLVGDGIEVAEFVKSRLPGSRVILLGCSLGSLIGLDMVRRRPDLFCAYIGTDQNVGMLRSHQVVHRAAIERMRVHGLSKGAAALEKLGAVPSRWSKQEYTANAQWTIKSDPGTYAGIMKLLRSAVWCSPGHTLRDIERALSGMNFSIAKLFKEITTTDAWKLGTRFDVPFFIIQGENDVVTPPGLAKEYFADVVAPIKDMAIVPGAGHFAAFTHPEEFLRIAARFSTISLG